VNVGLWTLRRKLIVLLIVASTLPVAVTSYLVYRRGRELLLEGATVEMLAVGDAATARLDAINEHYFAMLHALTRLPRVQEACALINAGEPAPEVVARSLAPLRESDEAIRAVVLLDARGVVGASTSAEYQGVDLSVRGYVQHARAVATPVVDLVVATRFAQPLPALSYAQQIDGGCIAVIGVRAEPLIARVRAYNGAAGPGSYVVLFDQHGIRLTDGLRDDLAFTPAGEIPADELAPMIAELRFGADTRARLDHVIAVPEEFERARAGELGDAGRIFEHHSPSNHETSYSIARRLSSTPWTVFVKVPKQTVESPVASLVGTVVPVALGILIAAFGAGLLLVQRILRPVRSLGRAASAIKAGDHAARVEVTTRDELGALGKVFNQMAEAIGTANDQLEQKVADRTQAMMAANELLQRHREELLAQRAELVVQKEELLAQRDELERKNTEVERADRMKSEFLANMSHELRTPLNSVIGFADLLQVTAEDRLTPAEHAHLGDIVGAGRHLLLIINDILDLAKIEAGHVRLQIDAVDPEDVVDSARAIVQGLARLRNIELRVAVPTRRAVRADADRLRQVLLNLLSNAIKFSPEGSAVDVRVSDRGDHVVFEVIDRGPGIPAELAAELFQPFVQGEGSLVKKHQGTGLGLAISKKLLELHDGTIELESKVGEGSTFRAVLPAAGRRARVGITMPPAATILLIEDRAIRGHRARLEAAGYRVETAATEADLGEAVAAVGATLLVVDVQDAGDAANRILERAAQLSATMPVILLSGEPQVLLPKPLDPEPLRALCRRLIAPDGERPRLLVIDDDPRVLELLQVTHGTGEQLEGAGTAADGLRQAREGGFHLHVVDLQLPDGSGFDVLDALEADPAIHSTPRIVLTALQLDDAQLDRLRRSAQAVATKGAVTPEELLGVIDRLVKPAAFAADRPAHRTILVVDDHDMNREVARSILERLGYRVIEARDGTEALAITERDRPDLILMDLAMPGMDGFTATRHLKAHPQLRRIPVIALSALAMKADEDKARAAGVDHFLTKPVDRLALESAVERLIAR
jgi:signal transduction histidine kinase/CheY-like chemotaxis protein